MSDLSAPAEIGGAPAMAPRRGTPPATAGAPPDPQQELDEGEGGVSLADMGFHSGEEVCSVCEYFDQQGGECKKATGGDRTIAQPDAAWCHGFEAADESTHGSDAMEEGEETAEGGK